MILKAPFEELLYGGGHLSYNVKGGSMRHLGGPPETKTEENMYPAGPPKGLIDPPFTL